jgi:hypothetical protein
MDKNVSIGIDPYPFYETSPRYSEWLHGTIWRGFEN